MAAAVRLSLLLVALLLLPFGSPSAQHTGGHSALTPPEHQHDGHAHGSSSDWEGSEAGKAYSEFNHHLAGLLVIVVGLTELRTALGIGALAWTRFLLPAAMAAIGIFLLIWSDHEAWPIGSLTLTETFFGTDWEIIQHKVFGVLTVTVGVLETLARLGWVRHPLVRMPLPVMAIVGGLALFLHSHGVHPAAHKIALHHAIMGTIAVTAGGTKLATAWGTAPLSRSGWWQLLWPALVMLIGVQLLVYSE